jgi:hypothetical protein
MKKIVTPGQVFGPYDSVEVMSDRYRVNDAADLPFTVVGQGTVEDVVEGDFPPVEHVPYIDPLAYQAQRAAEYPPMADYLDGIVKGDQAQVQAYIDACLAVKAKYPKP